MIKTLDKQGIERNFLYLIKGIYKNPIVNIILSERLDIFPLIPGMRQGCLLLLLLLNTVLKVLTNAISNKQINGSKWEMKLSCIYLQITRMYAKIRKS